SVKVYTRYCDGPCEPIEYAYHTVCSSCGYVDRWDDAGTETDHYYTKRALICGKTDTISSPAATVSFTPSTTAPTNTSVILDASVEVFDDNFALADAPYDFGAGYGTSSSFEVTENGTYTINVKDSQGRVSSTTVVVDCIDKEAPAINSISKDTNAWSEEGVVITVDAGDEKSGLAENPYSYEGRPYTADNTYRVTHNGDIVVRVKDAAGNVTETVIKITNVGRDPEVVAREEEAREYRLKLERERLLKEEAEKQALLQKQALEKKALEDARRKKEIAEASKKETVSDNNLLPGVTPPKKRAYMTADGKYKVYIGKDAAGKDIFKILEFGKSVSGNDTGKRGEKINVNKKVNLEERDNTKEEISDLTFAEENKSPKWVYASVGSLSLKAGMALALVGIIFFTFFNYVYIREKSKVKLVTLAKVKITDNKVIVSVNSKRFKQKGRYLLYFSPWIKLKSKKMPVYIKMDDSKNLIYCDNAEAFIY
ncbi:MAG: hypothetical protein J6X48_06305, partial [Lachnospiraceae bacterium]|nr:hypothetical protein [Lachnospiraceae bacterium]